MGAEMKTIEPKPWAIYLKVALPLPFAAVIMLYALGGGVAHYLGYPIIWDRFFPGLLISLLIFESQIFFNEYFNLLDRGKNAILPDPKPGEESGKVRLEQNRLVFLGFTFLTIAAVLVVMLFNQKALNPTNGFFLFLMALGWLMVSCPPLRLARSGFGQLMETFLIVYAVPAFALSLQIGSIHRLLTMNIFPLTCLYLAMLLVQQMPDFGESIRTGQKNLLTMLGCNWGMTIHNILIPLAYLLIGAALLVGMPWPLAWPAFLTIPLAAYEIWLMVQIDMGVKPRWRLLSVTSSGLFFLTAYMLAFSIWVR
jgi:1,4-dihydroxy-2-naphthoate octaprenyltransferase